MFISKHHNFLLFLQKLHISVTTITIFFYLVPCFVLAQLTHSSVKTALTSSTPPVSISDLVQIAIKNNPELIALQCELDAVRAHAIQATALPDPEITFGNAAQKSPLPFSGLKEDFSEISIEFSQELPWFGIRRLRKQIANAETETKLEEYEIAIRQTKYEIKTLYYEIYSLEQILKTIRQNIEIMTGITQTTETIESVHQTPKADIKDIIETQTEITELVEKQNELEARQTILTAKINSLLFRDLATPLEQLDSITFNLTPPPIEELIRAALLSAPEIKRNHKLIDINTNAVHLAKREAKYPEVELSFAYHNRPAFLDYYTYGIAFKLPFYAATKQLQAVKEQIANMAAAKSRLASVESTIKYRLRDAHVRATTAAKLITLNTKNFVPQTKLMLDTSIDAYKTNKEDFSKLLTILKKTVDYEIRYWELMIEYQKAIVEVETLTGLELVN